ncbi:chemotaxis protein CheX [Planctomycetota bacterium]
MIEQICIADVLLESIKEIFETMIFMSVEPCGNDTPSIEGEILMGSITYKGDIEGCLGICCAMDCAKAVAANMLCMDSPDEVTEEDLADAMGEVSNMVMGSIKTRLQDTIANIELSIPSVVAGRSLRTNLGDGTSRTQVNVTVGASHVVELSFVSRKSG